MSFVLITARIKRTFRADMYQIIVPMLNLNYVNVDFNYLKDWN